MLYSHHLYESMFQPHFIEEISEVQRGFVTSPRSYSCELERRDSNAGLSACKANVQIISKNLQRGLVGPRRTLAQVLPSYALGSISAPKGSFTTFLLHLPTNSVPSPGRSPWGGTSFLTHEHFRLEPEAPCLTEGAPERGDFLESLSGRTATAAGVTDLGPRVRRGDADPGVRP